MAVGFVVVPLVVSNGMLPLLHTDVAIGLLVPGVVFLVREVILVPDSVFFVAVDAVYVSVLVAVSLSVRPLMCSAGRPPGLTGVYLDV